MKKSSKNGFTLIELMIVIAIIAVLAAIGIPNFISYRNNSYCTRAEADTRNASAAIANWYSDPANTALVTTANLTASGFSVTDNNTMAIGGTVDAITVTVTDGSGRCPKGASFLITIPPDNANDGWQQAQNNP